MSDNSSSESEAEAGLLLEESFGDESLKDILKSVDNLETFLRQSNFNWFEVIQCLCGRLQKDVSCTSDSLFHTASTLSLNEQEMHLLKQSYLAYC